MTTKRVVKHSSRLPATSDREPRDRKERDVSTTGRRPRGRLTTEILRTVAQTRLVGGNRADVLARFPASDRPAVSKVLGRLVERAVLGERLVLNGFAEQVDLRGRGMVGARIDLVDLRRTNTKRITRRLRHMSSNEPWSQEDIVAAIERETANWLAKQGTRDVPNIVLLDIKIVHAAPFDILITVLFRRDRDLMEFVRKVIQRTPFVGQTQTMLVASSRSYSEPSTADRDVERQVSELLAFRAGLGDGTD